jgi:predicted metal-binding membrane protein
MTPAANTTASTRRFPGAVLNSPLSQRTTQPGAAGSQGNSSAPGPAPGAVRWAEIASLPRRERAFIPGCLLLLTAVAWLYLVHLSRQESAGMEYEKAMAAMGMPMHTAWTAADFWLTFSMWVVMMLGMMAPAAAPALMLFASAQVKRMGRAAQPAIAMFGLGYILVWAGFSVGATTAQWALHLRASSPRMAGAILLVTGCYQWTPWKNKCLTHCRSPLGFLMSRWRDGPLGSLQMGLRHGIFCLGCCWGLMCVLFATGVMNLLAVAALTALVLLEKYGPKAMMVSRGVGAALVLAGILLLADS